MTNEEAVDVLRKMQQANESLAGTCATLAARLATDSINAPVTANMATAGRVTRTIYKLGGESMKKLATLHPTLREVVQKAIGYSEQDFTVYETDRTVARQKLLIQNGTSRTMQSKHLIQSDGFAHAVDLVPWIGGKPVWDWQGCFRIAMAVDKAATELGHAKNIRWGGAWDRVLSDFGGVRESYAAEVEAYKQRHEGKDFIDGPHFELV